MSRRRGEDARGGARVRGAFLLAVAIAVAAAAASGEARADKVAEPRADGGPPRPPVPRFQGPTELLEVPGESSDGAAAPTLPEPRSIPVQGLDGPAERPEPPAPAPALVATPTPERSPASASAAASADAGSAAPDSGVGLGFLALIAAGLAGLGVLLGRALRRR